MSLLVHIFGNRESCIISGSHIEYVRWKSEPLNFAAWISGQFSQWRIMKKNTVLYPMGVIKTSQHMRLYQWDFENLSIQKKRPIKSKLIWKLDFGIVLTIIYDDKNVDH